MFSGQFIKSIIPKLDSDCIPRILANVIIQHMVRHLNYQGEKNVLLNPSIHFFSKKLPPTSLDTSSQKRLIYGFPFFLLGNHDDKG